MKDEAGPLRNVGLDHAAVVPSSVVTVSVECIGAWETSENSIRKDLSLTFFQPSSTYEVVQKPGKAEEGN
jgi:hypothetical protein